MSKRTPISELGKYGLIERITDGITLINSSTLVGAGDDAAVIDPGGKLTVVSTDLMLEGIHFNLVYTPLKHLGYKAVVRGVSDIYAMNGDPAQLLVSIAISSRFSIEEVDEFYEGVKLACNHYGVDLAGGDTSSSLTGLMIGVTATGTADPARIVRRSGANLNDLICITGNLGAAYMGLQLLERERKLFEKGDVIQPELKGYEYIVGRQLKPEFPVRALDDLTEAGITPTSMIDVSEGVASDLMQICKASGRGCRIFQERIPIDSETERMSEELGIEPLIAALNGGEDYELLFTAGLEEFDRISRIKSISIIGHITEIENGNLLIATNGEQIGLTAQGWKKPF
jgi:thiamine-monophosphate kinase